MEYISTSMDEYLGAWHDHPFPTLPRGEIKEPHAALRSMKDTSILRHPRLDTWVKRSPPRLHRPKPKKGRKDTHGAELAAAAQSVIDEYTQGGWELAYTDGSLDTHPQVGMVGGYGVYFGDHTDLAAPLPVNEKQPNNRGEIIITTRHPPPQPRKANPDLLGLATGCHGGDRQSQQMAAPRLAEVVWTGGPCGPVGTTLHEITRAGPAVRWLHVPSHVGIHGNTKADTLADMGRRRSPLLKGLVTAARRSEPPNDDELDDVSDLEEPPLWSPEETGERKGRNPPPPQTTSDNAPPPHPRQVSYLHPPAPEQNTCHPPHRCRGLHASVQTAAPG